MSCLGHGSAYAIDGRRVSGPAPSALAKYAITFDGADFLEIKISGLGYSVAVASVAGEAQSNPRLRLDFRALRNVDYEVRFQEALDKESLAIPFALTPSDPAEQTVFTPSTTANVSLFVESTAAMGLFSIAVRVTEI